MTVSNRAPSMGRPSRFNQALADLICAELATGKSMRTVCRADDMPAMSTVFKWLRERPEFSEQYARAKAESADALVEEIIDIADDATNDWMEVHDKDGNSVGYKLNGEHVQRSRLRVDARKWIASKLKPKKYGERLDLAHGIVPANPLADLIQKVQGSALMPVCKPTGRSWTTCPPVHIPTEVGHGYRFDAGRCTDLKAAMVPI